MEYPAENIEELFTGSWVRTELFFNELVGQYGWAKLVPVLAFIKRSRRQDMDKYFRSGTSMYTLTLSRSIQHGLREDQSYVSIETIDLGTFSIRIRNGLDSYESFTITSLDDQQLMDKLSWLKNITTD